MPDNPFPGHLRRLPSGGCSDRRLPCAFLNRISVPGPGLLNAKFFLQGRAEHPDGFAGPAVEGTAAYFLQAVVMR